MEEVAKVISGAPFPSNASKLKAQAVLALLRKLGFISDLGISAIEAERAMK